MFPAIPKTKEMQPGNVPLRAATYVRMSTDHQQYSIENQMQIISEYANARGIEIIHTYCDAARSGVTLNRRDGLRRLISDVREGTRDGPWQPTERNPRWRGLSRWATAS
jgi:predicted site-specific integrase-resolvase